MSDFGNTLKNLRKQHKITQRDLAERVGVDFTYISKIETGAIANPPSEKTIIQIAKVLGTNADELILLAKKVPETIRETIVDDDLAAAFLRKVPRFSEEQRKIIKDLIDEV
ncbi:transcriptional regulator, XRE family [Desulfitobacterium hafniense DCB-2]|uniref:Transcriptional regulator, XRE n=2 Tax=Desulfitobacterium hafniense TaxID=49338 RepID=A0A098AX52_DESHA|nr:helix-turn-helix transcriptional regulator [Desulfitobacterium hafniense]ACL18715.1 transcriptional regulator, XRE family [Desulfitobacterium hafniense DCB-2]CDX00685.1 Transcriptional regulator, XRE [Desulfitobacterium hafniense]